MYVRSWPDFLSRSMYNLGAIFSVRFLSGKTPAYELSLASLIENFPVHDGDPLCGILHFPGCLRLPFASGFPVTTSLICFYLTKPTAAMHNYLFR